jgi:RNA polymerase sigma-70 factor, ECF subfamily
VRASGVSGLTLAGAGRLPISLERYLPGVAYENVGVTDVVERAFRRHYGTVYRYVRRRSRSHEQAEDLTQEVFAAAAAALPSENVGDPPVLAWLYTVAQRRFADEVRRRAHERPVALAPEPAVEYAPSVAGAITAALHRLQPDEQRVLALKLLRGLRFAEVGTELGVTPAAAKMRFVRALSALREEPRMEGVEP